MTFDFPEFYKLVPPEYLHGRAERAAAMCREKDLDGLLLTANLDTYYMSGTMQQGVVLVDADGRVSPLMRRNAERAAAETPWEVIPITGLSQAAAEIKGLLGEKARLGMPFDVLYASEYLGWAKRLEGMSLKDATKPWLYLKGVKDQWEIDTLLESGRVAGEVYKAARDLIRPGVSEAWLAGQLLAVAVELGHVDLLRTRNAFMETFSWHIVSGREGAVPSAIDAPFGGYGNSPAFPLGASLKKFRKGEHLLVDFGICVQGYITDQTRTYSLGPAPKIVRQAHDCLVAVQKTICDNLRPGAVSGEIFAKANQTAREYGMEDYFLGKPHQRIKFVGHGLGLELGSPPYILQGSKAVVQAGEAYALELKIVLDEGPVGLENTLAVRPDGPPLMITPMEDVLHELDV
jgi:Xaa-Pro aminopeptidase